MPHPDSQARFAPDQQPTLILPASTRRSIRRQLELDAQQRLPGLKLAGPGQRRRQCQQQAPRRALRWQDRVLLSVGIVLLTLVLLRIETAEAQTAAQAQTQAPQWGLELHTPGGTETQLALNTELSAEVTGLVSRVVVTQTFTNPGPDWAEGIYRFPLPAGAAVDRLFIQVGEQLIEGEIQEKHTARRVYQQARADGITASLVSQQKPNQFETRLANIAPGEEIKVSIGFLLTVDYHDGAFSLRLPMTFTPRWSSSTQHLAQQAVQAGPAPLVAALSGASLAGAAINHLANNPAAINAPAIQHAAWSANHGLSLDIMIRTGISLSAIESHYHDVDIQPLSGGYQVRLLDLTAQSDRDFELSWVPDLRTVPQSSLMTFDDGDAVYAQLMLTPPLPEAITEMGREVVFIIDTSGSMEGASMDQARAALHQGLAVLQEDDYFNLLEFNSETELLFRASVPASAPNITLAGRYIDGLVANGGTVMAPALQAAFRLPRPADLMRQVVFVTDGSVDNETELLAAIGHELGDSRLFTVAIGSAPNAWFMRKAAEIGRGSHTHIGKLTEVASRMQRLWDHIRLPALSDICVDWGMDAEYYPEIIPDLYAGEPLWVIAKLPARPVEVALCGTLAGQPWTDSIPLHDHGAGQQGTDTLATLWARQKIAALEESVVFGADRQLARAAIVDVALHYGLLTAHTSLVAVDRAPARPRNTALATGKVPNLMPAGSSLNSIGLPQTATGWQAQLLLSALSLLVAGWMLMASINITTRRKPATVGGQAAVSTAPSPPAAHLPAIAVAGASTTLQTK